MELNKIAVYGWLAARMFRLSGSDVVGARISAAVNFFISEMEPRAKLASQLAVMGGGLLGEFDALLVSSRDYKEFDFDDER